MLMIVLAPLPRVPPRLPVPSSVLSLDDDILIPCTTIESTFARWRTAPQQLAGYYPRLLVPPEGGSGAPVYQFEEFVFQQVGVLREGARQRAVLMAPAAQLSD